MTPLTYKISATVEKLRKLMERTTSETRDGEVLISFKMSQGGIRDNKVKISVEEKV